MPGSKKIPVVRVEAPGFSPAKQAAEEVGALALVT